MIAGSLEFSLGMQANNFLQSLGLAGGKLLSFVGIATTVGTAIHKMWEAIEEGGDLKDLSVRTGASVKSLYSLKEAFIQIGASADSAAPMILKLQRQLASKEGSSLLKSIGLDPEALQGQEAVEQINSIGAALSKLGASQQSKVAFGLFGREGASTALQIARSGHEFQDAIAATRGDADIWQKTANRFDAIGDKVKEIQGHIQTGFALAAGALIAAFENGTLGNLIVDTVSTALQVAWNAFLGSVPLLGAALLDAFKVPLAYLQAGMEYAIQEILNNPKISALLGAIPGGSAVGVALGIGIGSSERVSFGDIFKQTLEEGVKFNLGNGEFGIGDIKGAAQSNFSERFGAAGSAIDAFKTRLLELISGLPQDGPRALDGEGGVFGKGQKPDVTALEKIGLVIGGKGAVTGADYARNTADNTRLMLKEQQATNKLLASPTTAPAHT